MQNEKPRNNKQGRSSDRVLYVILACMLVIIVVLIILLLRPCSGGGENHISTELDRDPNASIGQLEGKTPEEIEAELNRIVEEGMFNISINPAPVFPSGSEPGNLRIENIPSNKYNMTVKITLDETGEIIYQSGIIEPNHHIESDVLDVILEKGKYNATAVFTAYEPENNRARGQAAVKILIQVQN